jgi:hypothetical protein
VTDRTLQELSTQAKLHYEARDYMLAQSCLIEARKRFPQEEGKELNQDGDGSIVRVYADARGNEIREQV